MSGTNWHLRRPVRPAGRVAQGAAFSFRFSAGALAAGILAAACVPSGYYYRVSDNLRADANPTVLRKFEVDKTACEGQAAAAALAGGPNYNLTQRELVMRGCMAEKGYIVR